MDNPFDLSEFENARHGPHWHSEVADGKAHAWSLIAAYAEGFCYNYEYLVRFFAERNSTCGWGSDQNYFSPCPIPTALEFLELLEFREREFERALDHPGVEWNWPTDWGQVSWGRPVVAGGPVVAGVPSVDRAALCGLRLQETQRAIAVHKALLGHRSPIRWGHGLADQYVAVLFKIFFSHRPLFSDGNQGYEYSVRAAVRCSPILASYDPPDVSRGDDHHWDTCRLLGLYRGYVPSYDPWQFPRPEVPEIVILERGLNRCSVATRIPRQVLERIVLAHELSHWMVHLCPDRAGNTWERTAFDATASDVHEGWAQLLTSWVLTDVRDAEALAAFNHLARRQSPVYDPFAKLPAAGADRASMLGALPSIRSQSRGATMADWLAAL
jgi:hypothetical protein